MYVGCFPPLNHPAAAGLVVVTSTLMVSRTGFRYENVVFLVLELVLELVLVLVLVLERRLRAVALGQSGRGHDWTPYCKSIWEQGLGYRGLGPRSSPSERSMVAIGESSGCQRTSMRTSLPNSKLPCAGGACRGRPQQNGMRVSFVEMSVLPCDCQGFYPIRLIDHGYQHLFICRSKPRAR